MRRFLESRPSSFLLVVRFYTIAILRATSSSAGGGSATHLYSRGTLGYTHNVRGDETGEEKSALKVCQSPEEAQEWMQANGGEWVQERLGEDKRCLNYCPFGKQGLCPYRGQT